MSDPITPETVAPVQSPRKYRAKKLITYNAKGEEVCGAKRSGASRQAGKPVYCQSTAINRGNGRCEKHGGRSPRGIASPHFKTGRFAQDLPVRMLADYHANRDDPAILDLRDEVALIRSRNADLLRRVDSGESGVLWRTLRETFAEFKQLRDALGSAQTKEDRQRIGDAMSNAFAGLDRLINAGLADYAAWDAIERNVLRTERVVRSERKRKVELGQLILVSHVVLLVGALTDSIRRHVNDSETLSNINADFLRLTEGISLEEPNAA